MRQESTAPPGSMLYPAQAAVAFTSFFEAFFGAAARALEAARTST